MSNRLPKGKPENLLEDLRDITGAEDYMLFQVHSVELWVINYNIDLFCKLVDRTRLIYILYYIVLYLKVWTIHFNPKRIMPIL